MSIFAGLDARDKTIHVCVVDDDGAILKRDVVASDPDALAKWLVKHCDGLARVVLETGPLSTLLYHGMVERGVPIVCICARHAKGVLATRVNKSDVHVAEGLAQLARTGWFKRVNMKASATHIDRAALRIRAQLITARVAMGNQLRGLLTFFGLRLGAAHTPGKPHDEASQANAMSAATYPKPEIRCCGDRSTRLRTSCYAAYSGHLLSRNGGSGSLNQKAISGRGSRLRESSPFCSIRYG